MELYDDIYQKPQKKSKLPMIIGISIVVLIILSILIIYGIIYLQSTVTKITLDGANASKLEKIFYIEETQDGTKLYIPIREIAQYFGYEDYSGDYSNKSEDQSKCHVKNEIETAMFTLNSNVLIKTRGGSDYEYIDLDEKVFEKDGKLYTTIDGIKNAYNVEFIYDSEDRNIEIYTMDYLINYYAQYLKIEKYKTTFSDKKAIFENMIIISQNGQEGVINATTGESILETKYDAVSYLPNTKDFLVKSNGKYGIVSKDAQIKVKLAYDDIKIMDNQNGLYLVKQNTVYGVVDAEGNTVIQPEYQQIGMSISQFSQNAIENQYIILNKLIPIKNNNLWGFFNLKGEKVTDFKYTELGCVSSNVTNTYPVLVVPSYEIIVVGKDKRYNLMRTNGTEVILGGYILDSVYMKTNAETGQNTYYMTYNNGNTTVDIEEKLSSVGE